MFSFLLCIIYLSFVGLGLPDSLLGSAWPLMHLQLEAPLAWAGAISIIVTAGTVVSSLFAPRITARRGAGRVTLISTAVSALALAGFAVAPSVLWLCVLAVPYGLAAGCVDAALNHYVAIHFRARHMSWLHCFWGVGACISPYIMSAFLAHGENWRGGYGFVAAMEAALAVVLASTLRLWKTSSPRAEKSIPSEGLLASLRVKGVGFSVLSFGAYMALEVTTGLWVSSYLVEHRSADPVIAAQTASFFYIGITAARFVIGLFADRFSDRAMVRWGVGAMLAGTALMCLPVEGNMGCVTGLILTGIGGAPLYPSLIHATPDNFGVKYSQSVIGLQMAVAYLGSTLGPPVFVAFFPLDSLPLFLFGLSLCMLFTTEGLWYAVRKKTKPQ